MFLLLAACTAPSSPGGLDVAPALTVVKGEDLTEDAAAAIARMPAWLRPDLRLALVQASEDRQDLLAATILDLEDAALLDEVGFAMAHLSKEVLNADHFYPELLVENARRIYEVDPLLEYVELVETGEAGVDADWWTTTRYQVEAEGAVTAVDLDPELYYWYVVHPRIEDENPWYIDAWAECDRASLECAATPETGTFWRSFLWSAAAETCPEGESCPVVQDYLPGATVLYGAADQDDAVHRVASMMLDSPDGERWLNFGASGERSIQPNRIYTLGRGNCGEWADMTSAIARTALIPNVNVTPSSWDHTWSAFYLDRWIAYEPVNWWFDYAYASGYVTYAARGDASVWYQTEQYTSTVATLEVNVKDAEGNPVDGASVVLWSPYDTSYWYAGEQVSDLDGVARFTVGADLAFGYTVSSDLGESDGIEGTVAGIPAGGTASSRVRLDASLAPIAAPETAAARGSMTVAVDLTAEGRLIGTSYRLGDRSTQPTAAPTLTTWVLSWEDYEAFEAGEPFSVVEGLDRDEGGVVVVGNLGAHGTAAIGELTVTVGGDGVTATTLTRPYALLAGEWVAIGVGA